LKNILIKVKENVVTRESVSFEPDPMQVPTTFCL